MAEDKKGIKDKNFEKVAVAIAALLGMTHKTYEELAAVPQDLQKVIVHIHENPSLLDKIESNKIMRMKTVEKEAIEAVSSKSRYMKVATSGDNSVCPACAKWQGKIICIDGTDPNYPSLDDYLRSGAFHPNCKCALQELSTQEIQRKHIQNSLCFSGCTCGLVFN